MHQLVLSECTSIISGGCIQREKLNTITENSDDDVSNLCATSDLFEQRPSVLGSKSAYETRFGSYEDQIVYYLGDLHVQNAYVQALGSEEENQIMNGSKGEKCYNSKG